MDMNTRQVKTPDGISWHVEQFKPKQTPANDSEIEHVVLIPSGEGDCYNFRKVAIMLAAEHGFAVTTFDMPGYSRTTAPHEAITKVTPQMVAQQVSTLLSALQIPRASFFGSSSGGGAVLAITALFPERVKCAIVHEVPFGLPPPEFLTWREQSDDFIIKTCQDFFRNMFIEEANNGRAKWDALGPEYHKRLEQNYVMWQRNLVTTYEPQTRVLATPENLKRRPVFWTVGAMSRKDFWPTNFELAESAGLEVNTTALNCMHFAYVTVPEQTTKWIVECVGKVTS